MFTAAQIKAFQRCLAWCDANEAKIAKLVAMSQYAPAFAQRIDEMKRRCEVMRNLATMALSTEQ